MIRNNVKHLYKNVCPHIFKIPIILSTRTDTYNYNLKHFSTNLQPKLQSTEQNYDIEERTIASPKFQQQSYESVSQNLDKVFYKIDLDVKRTGRIKKHELQNIIHDIKSQKHLTSVQALLLIRCCGNLLVEEPLSERRNLTDIVWNLIQKIGVPLDISHYNSLLKIYAENQDFEKIPDPFQYLEAIKTIDKTRTKVHNSFLEPNRVTYQRILALYCEQGDVTNAAKILESMKAQDMAINEAIFCLLMRGYAHAGDMASSKDIVNIMKQSKLEPTSLTYITLATIFAQSGNSQELQEILQEANQKGITFMNKDLIDVIFSLATYRAKTNPNSDGPKFDVKDTLSPFMAYLKPHHDFVKNAINLTSRLLAVGGLDKEAYELFKYLTLNASDQYPEFGGIQNPLTNSGMFIVKQMCTQTVPKHTLEDLAYICRDMHSLGINTFATQKALELAYTHQHAKGVGATDRALFFMNMLRELNLPIRLHYFWPLMVRPLTLSKGGSGNARPRMWDLLSTIKTDFNMSPNFETLVNYVYPILDPGSGGSRSGRRAGPSSQDLEEAMDEDYEDGGHEAPVRGAGSLPQILNKLAAPHGSGTGRDASPLTNLPLALNAWIYYKTYVAASAGGQFSHPQAAPSSFLYTHDLLRTLNDPGNESLRHLGRLVEPRFLMGRLGDLYATTLKSLTDGSSPKEAFAPTTTTKGATPLTPQKLTAMLCDVLRWVSPQNSSLTVSSTSGTEHTHKPVLLDEAEIIPDIEIEHITDHSSYDWNGKVLSDICHQISISQVEPVSLVRPIIEAYRDNSLHISNTAYDKIAAILKLVEREPELDTTLKSLIAPGLELASMSEALQTGMIIPGNYGGNRSSFFGRTNGEGNSQGLVYRDTELPQLENLLLTYEQKGSNALTLKRHMLLRYCRTRPYNSARIEELKESLTTDYPSSGLTPAAYAALIDCYVRSGNGDAALDMKKQAEMFDPMFRTSVPKILDLCSLLITKHLDEPGTSSQVLSLLNDAAIMPSPTPIQTSSSQNFGGASEEQFADGPNPSSPYAPSSTNFGPALPRNNTEYLAWKLLTAAAGNPEPFAPPFGSIVASVADTKVQQGRRPIPDFEKIYDKTVGLLETVVPPHRNGARYRPSPSILGTLISAHINKGETDSAVKAFERFAAEYHVTPNMSYLLRYLIDSNDTENLQKTVDISSGIHTEINVLIDLLFVFIELGRMKEANKIIETPGLWYKPLRFQHYCNKYVRERKVKELEYLISATKNIRDMDRDQMYYYLLQAHERNNDWQSALNVWTSMEEENVQPSNQTLHIIAELMQRNGQVVPFALSDHLVSSENPIKIKEKLATSRFTRPSQAPSDPFASLSPQDGVKERELLQFINSGDIEKALDIKNELTTGGNLISNRVYYTLLENLISKDDMIDKAIEVAREIRSKRITVPMPILKSLMSRLSFLGLADTIRQEIPPLLLIPSLVEKINVEKFVSYAYTNKEKASEYLKIYEDSIDTDRGQRPPQGMLYALNKQPEILDRVVTLSTKYANKGIYHLDHILFTYYTLKGDYEKAKNYYEDKIKSHLEMSQKFTEPDQTSDIYKKYDMNFGTICKDARLKNDDTSLQFLLKEINLENNKFGCGLIYSYLISLKCHNNKYDEALEIYNEALDKGHIQLMHIKVFALRELKNSLESIGKTAPFEMPQQGERDNFIKS